MANTSQGWQRLEPYGVCLTRVQYVHAIDGKKEIFKTKYIQNIHVYLRSKKTVYTVVCYDGAHDGVNREFIGQLNAWVGPGDRFIDASAKGFNFIYDPFGCGRDCEPEWYPKEPIGLVKRLDTLEHWILDRNGDTWSARELWDEMWVPNQP